MELSVIGVEKLKLVELNIRKAGVELKDLCNYYPTFQDYLMRFNGIWREMDDMMRYYDVTPLHISGAEQMRHI